MRVVVCAERAGHLVPRSVHGVRAAAVVVFSRHQGREEGGEREPVHLPRRDGDLLVWVGLVYDTFRLVLWHPACCRVGREKEPYARGFLWKLALTQSDRPLDYGISLRARLVSTAISPASRCDCKRQQATAERSTAPYPKYLRSAGGIPTVLHIDGQWRSSWPTPQVAGVLEVSQLPGASETRTELLQSVVATSAAATPSEAACAKRHGRIKTDDCRHGASGSQFGEGRCSRRC